MSELPATTLRCLPEHSAMGSELGSIAAMLTHQKTECIGVNEGQRRGSALWTEKTGGRTAWVSWSWTEVQPHVLTVDTAPFSVRSNLALRDHRGEPLAPSKRAIALLTLVHALPWRRPAMDLLYPGQDIPSDWINDH